MNLHHLLYNKQRLSVVLLGAAVVAFVLMVVKITSFLEASARAQNLLKRAVTPEEPAPKNAGQTGQASWVVAEQLKKSNLFSPPAPPRNPVTSVLGILGDEVLIADKWYKAGDTIADAEILAVEPTHIRVRWQGRETVFAPIEIDPQRISDGSQPTRRETVQVNRTPAPTRSGTPTSQPPRTAPARTSRSERIPPQNRPRSSTEADKKRQLSNERQQYLKSLKQDLKAPKSETATKKTHSAAVAVKKATVAEAKKSARKPSQ